VEFLEGFCASDRLSVRVLETVYLCVGLGHLVDGFFVAFVPDLFEPALKKCH
jgi:hypothetical protein